MAIGWLIDAGVFEAYHDEFVEAVTRNGHTAVSVNRPDAPYVWDDVQSSYRNAFPKGACVVTHSDIDLVSRVMADNLWTPGAFATVPHYFCSHYFSHFGRYLLNQDYIMLPYAELPRCRDFLFDALGRDGRIFVRPDSPLKIFTGQVVCRESFDQDYEFLGFYEFPPEEIVIVSSPKEINTEWRFVVANGEVVTGSLYSQRGSEVSLPVSDTHALEFASSVASLNYQPDPVWVLDVCRTADGDYRLLEIGGFSFASLYGSDKDQIVRTVSAIAEGIHANKVRQT